MGKQKRSILLPRNPKATRFFGYVKIILTAILTAYLIGLIVWTINVFTHYKGKIKETKGHIKYRHHSQFFIITGVYIAATTAYGLWTVLEENISRCKTFLILTVIGFVFELVGSNSSNDEEVKQLKWVTLVFEPLLVVGMLIYLKLLTQQAEDLIYSPQYRRKMADSPRNSSDEDEDDADTLTLIPPTNVTTDGAQSFQRKHPYSSVFSHS